MTDAFETCLATLRAEGGYVDDPADPGSATNRGITLATLRQWSDDPDAGIPQVKDMPLRTARAIYRALYMAFGFTGEEVDGCIARRLWDWRAKFDARSLVNDLAERQVAFYRSLPEFAIFRRRLARPHPSAERGAGDDRGS
jgi:Glycosyl hydrolase 108